MRNACNLLAEALLAEAKSLRRGFGVALAALLLALLTVAGCSHASSQTFGNKPVAVEAFSIDEPYYPWAMTFSQNGSLLAVEPDILHPRGIHIWDLKTRRLLQTLSTDHRGSNGGGPRLVFSSDGRWLTACLDEPVILRVWDTQSWRSQPEPFAETPHAGGCKGLVLDRNNDRLLMANGDGQLTARDAPGFKEAWLIQPE